MLLPDAVIIGAQKAATTGLYRTLATHPDVVALSAQEAGVLHRGVDEWEPWLRTKEPEVHGRPDGPALIAKLATAMYFDDTLQTISALNPRTKVVAVLRHPVERLLSLHRYAVQRGLESRPTEVALRSDVVERASAWRLDSYSEGSRYAAAIDRVHRTFAGAALFVDYADVHSGACLPSVQEFLGLSSGGVHAVRANESHEPRSLALARVSASPVMQRVVKSAVPTTWRTRLRDGVAEWNTTVRSAGQAPISGDFHEELTARHLPDVLAAEAAVGKDLPAWRT